MGASSSHQNARRAFQATSLGSGLAQGKQNGKSILGTLLAPLLPIFLTNNPTPNGFPWSLADINTNYYDHFPNTGVIRNYEFTISRGVIAPDGYDREVLLVNDAFPGPLIEANWGDTIQVTVHNNITGPEEGTALHWHGFLQSGAPWQDGVPSVTQCPIAPGKTFTYNFKAELYGSTWYHSHYSAQYAGGIIGPMVIHGPTQRRYDIDVGPVILGDWYHDDYFKLVQKTMANNGTGPFMSNNNLINGKMNFDCSKKPADDKTPCVSNAGVSKFRFKRGKTHRLRLMNVGAEGMQRFSIDGHKMTVIANDFIPVVPYDTEVVGLGIGQRVDVLVNADAKGDAFWMRSHICKNCAFADNPDAQAAIFYDGADENNPPVTTAVNDPEPESCDNDALDKTKPIVTVPALRADKTFEIDLQLTKNDSGVTLWTMDGMDFRGNYNSPTLLLSNLGNYTFDKHWNVQDTENARVVRVVLHNNSPADHPMHLHGFNMQILHSGSGDWDGTIVRQWNPQRRDVAMVPKKGHLVLQFDAGKNPGVWPFHCHIAWHVSAGLMVQFLTGGDKLKHMHVPKVMAETCREWGTWTNTHIPDQIDSGL